MHRADNCAGLDVYPTPHVPDAQLQYWGAWYRLNNVAQFGIRFIAFMQDPVGVANALATEIPTIKVPSSPRARPLTAPERFSIAQLIFRERKRARRIA